jgi:hypothetical protein
MTSLEGSCFCEKVVFVVEAPTKWCGHCHCSICQKIHGSGVVTWVGCENDSVRFDKGEEQVSWFESSKGAARGSCSACGSQMFFKSINWPGELHITRTCFSAEIDREPSGHSFFDSHVPWLTCDDELPRNSGVD